MYIRRYNFQDTFVEILKYLDDEDTDTVVREQKTREMLFAHISIVNPETVCYFLPFRKDNIFAKIAETLWVLDGRNDIGWLSYYLPRAADYSDDGVHWRAGYGPRLRNLYHGGVDQVEMVLHRLRGDPSTRQAVISLWDPIADTTTGSKDYPCNNWLHFLIRDNQISLSVAQRSADVMWGWSNINAFEWSTLLKMMAFWTNTEVGSIEWYVTSMHLYERHYDISKKICQAYGEDRDVYNLGKEPKFSTEFSLLDMKIHEMMKFEHDCRNSAPDILPIFSTFGLNDELLNVFAMMLAIYVKFQQNSSNSFLANLLRALPDCQYKYAAILHIARERPDILTFLPCGLVTDILTAEQSD